MANSRRERFYRVLNEAISDFTEHGFDGQERLDRWLAAVREAAVHALIPEHELEDLLKLQLGRAFRAATADVVLRAKHPGIEAFKLEHIRYGLRSELRSRVVASVSLIKLNQAASVNRTLQRLAGWASSIPAGGSRNVDKLDTKQHIRRSIAGLPFEERRVIIDQGHKLTAAINDVVARDGGAIAMRWHHIAAGPPAYHSRPEHVARNGKIFVIRDNWAIRDGLIKLAGHKYLDEIDQPAELPFCSCSGVYIYVPSSLPPEMWTVKGRAVILRAMSHAA